MKTSALAVDGPSPALELGDPELDRLLEAFSADPSDERTFGRLEVLLRGRGRWEIVPDERTAHVPPEKRA